MELIPEGIFGIERETLRITADGRLAQTPHPFRNPGLERDFCENQLEIITPPCRSIPEAMQSLATLDREARELLNKQGETLWLYSNPPHIDSEDEIPVAFFREESRAGKNRYRRYLEQKYGKRLMLLSGIHFNVSFSPSWLEALRTKSAPSLSYSQFRDAFYLKLTGQAITWSWLLVLLTSASPVCDVTLNGRTAKSRCSEYASVRNGRAGYWNAFVPVLDYTDLSGYIRSVEAYVKADQLYSAAELYLPVRLKPKGVNRIQALRDGVSHIELRMLDLNPLEPLGIAERDLHFAYLLLVYLAQKEASDFTPALQQQAVRQHQAAAALHIDGTEINGKPVLTAAQGMLDSMAAHFSENAEALAVIRYEQDKLTNRLCERIQALSGEQLYYLLMEHDTGDF